MHLVRVAATVGGRTTHSKLTDRLHVWSRHWDLDGFGTTVFSEGSSGRLAGWGGLHYPRVGVAKRLMVGYVVARLGEGQILCLGRDPTRRTARGGLLNRSLNHAAARPVPRSASTERRSARIAGLVAPPLVPTVHGLQRDRSRSSGSATTMRTQRSPWSSAAPSIRSITTPLSVSDSRPPIGMDSGSSRHATRNSTGRAAAS